MKKSVLTVFGIILSLLALTSCERFKSLSNKKNTKNNINVIVPIKDDINLYNSYFLKYKNGQTQTLQYEYQYNFYRVIDSTKIERIDTLQYKVHWKDLK